MPPPMNPANAKLKVELEIVPKTGQTSAAMQQLEERARRLSSASRASSGADSRGGASTSSSRRLAEQVEARQEQERSGLAWTELNSKAAILSRVLSGVATAMSHFSDVSLSTGQKMLLGMRDTINSLPIVGDISRIGGGIATEVFFGDDRRDMNRALEERLHSQYSAIVQQGAFRKEEIERSVARSRYESQAMGRFGGTRGYSARLMDSLGLARPRGSDGASWAQFAGIAEPLAGLFEATIGDARSPFGMAASSFLGLAQAAKPEAIREAERQAELARRPLFVAQQEFADARFGRSAAQQQVEQAQARLEEVRRAKKQGIPLPPTPFMPQGMDLNTPNVFSDSARLIRENQALEDLKRAQERLERSIRTEQEKGLAVESKKYELNQKTLDIRRVELRLLKDRQNQAEGQMNEFGAMDDLGRYRLLEGLKTFQERGYRGTPREVIEMLRGNSMTRQMITDAEGKDAENDPIFEQVRERVGAPNLKDIIRERGEVERAIEALDEKYQTLFRDQIQKVYETFAGPLKKLLDDMTLGMTKMLENQQALQTNGKLMGQ